jgi:hypothetical protein
MGERFQIVQPLCLGLSLGEELRNPPLRVS